MNMKLDVCRFSNEDVIATSGFLPSTITGLFYIPASDYDGGSLGSSGYVSFNGNGGGYDSAAGGYLITDIYGAYLDTDNERDDLINKGGEMAAFVPASFFEGLAEKTYDAYSYGGNYYTNGVNYYTTYYTN